MSNIDFSRMTTQQTKTAQAAAVLDAEDATGLGAADIEVVARMHGWIARMQAVCRALSDDRGQIFMPMRPGRPCLWTWSS